MRNFRKHRLSAGRRRSTSRRNFLRLERLETRLALAAVATNDFFHDLIDRPDPGAQLGPADWLLAPVTRRRRVSQHLPHRLASQPELPGRFELAHL